MPPSWMSLDRWAMETVGLLSSFHGKFQMSFSKVFRAVSGINCTFARYCAFLLGYLILEICGNWFRRERGSSRGPDNFAMLEMEQSSDLNSTVETEVLEIFRSAAANGTPRLRTHSGSDSPRSL